MSVRFMTAIGVMLPIQTLRGSTIVNLQGNRLGKIWESANCAAQTYANGKRGSCIPRMHANLGLIPAAAVATAAVPIRRCIRIAKIATASTDRAV